MMWLLGSGLAVAAALVAGVWWLRGRYVQVTIDGRSMEPSYNDGEVVLMRRLRSGRVETGDVVALVPLSADDADGVSVDVPTEPRREGRLWIVKRVAAASGDPVPPDLGPALTEHAGKPVPAGYLVLLGDNPDHSHDSRQEGFAQLDRVRAVSVH